MNKRLSFGAVLLAALLLVGCNNNASSQEAPSSKNPARSVSKQPSSQEPARSVSSNQSSSQGPVKSVNDLSISLGNEGSKAYITVRGTQQNYTADDFSWAWGIADQSGNFADGKATPSASDFKKETFDANNQFVVKYCLTDIETLKAGTLYNIYGGTPESYSMIQFASNMFGANDATRNYYLRQDQDNALTFDNIQPLTYTEASIVELAAGDLPSGVTYTGAYLKIGAANSKNLTMDMINGWHQAGNIAGDFQRVIPANSYQLHVHEDTQRFWEIKDNKVYFYLYVGFIAKGEGWMVHFDVVSGNQNAGCSYGGSPALAGETAYKVAEGTEDEMTYRIYGDSSKSGEENYWGCLGVYCDE